MKFAAIKSRHFSPCAHQRRNYFQLCFKDPISYSFREISAPRGEATVGERLFWVCAPRCGEKEFQGPLRASGCSCTRCEQLFIISCRSLVMLGDINRLSCHNCFFKLTNHPLCACVCVYVSVQNPFSSRVVTHQPFQAQDHFLIPNVSWDLSTWYLPKTHIFIIFCNFCKGWMYKKNIYTKKGSCATVSIQCTIFKLISIHIYNAKYVANICNYM